MGGRRPRRPSGQPDPAGRAVHDRPWRDPRQRHHLGDEPGGEEGRPHVLLPGLPAARARRPRRRLLDAGALPHRARAVDERLPDRPEREPLDRARDLRRQGEGRDDPGQRSPPDARAARPARRPERARQALRRRRRARRPHGEGAGDVLLADVRPESGRGELRPGDGRPRRLQAARRAAEPRHGRPLRAGLDLQGHDGVRGDRVRPLHARLQLRRPRLLRGLRQAREQLRHDKAVRPARPAHGARQLGQLRLLQHRQGAGREVPRRVHEAVRVLRAAAAGDTGGRARAQRHLQGHEAVRSRQGLRRRSRPARVRAGAAAGDAAADGDGRRHDRERRRRDEAAGDRPDRRARRLA